MGVKRNTQGPLFHAELMQIGGSDAVVFWDRSFPPGIPPEDTDEDVIVEMADRHDLMAFRKLGSSQQGWVIMERNRDIIPEEFDMRLWPNDWVPGLRIKIPTQESLNRRGIVQ